MSEEIFRFVAVRPATRITASRLSRGFASYPGGKELPLQSALAALEPATGRELAAKYARRRLDDPEPEPILAEVQTLVDAVGQAAGKATAAQARQVLEAALAMSLEQYLASERAHAVEDMVWERLYAHAIVPDANSGQRAAVWEAARALHFARFLLQQNEDEPPLAMRELQTVTLLVPPSLAPPAPPAARAGVDASLASFQQQLTDVAARISAINRAIADISNGEQAARAETSKPEAAGAPSGARLLMADAPDLAADDPPDGSPGLAAQRSTLPAFAMARASLPALAERVSLQRAGWISDARAQRFLRQETRDLLAARPTLTSFDAPTAVQALEQERHDVVRSFLSSLPAGMVQHIRDHPQAQALLASVPVSLPGLPPDVPPLQSPVPGSAVARGVKVLGVGDLLVVRQDLMFYSPGDIAHVENVMKGEHFVRTHTRTNETQTTVLLETESVTETERDVQSTDRFELQKETESAAQIQLSVQAGVSVTSLGPVSVTSHADVGLQSSAASSSHTAVTMAKEVTDRAVQAVREKVRRQKVTQTLERVEERNEHGIDNREKGEHAVGMYRWLDKHYKARLINYGRRLMLEFIVPDPSAFYRYMQTSKQVAGAIARPSPPVVHLACETVDLQPDLVTEANYPSLVAQYNVQDVEPCPPWTCYVGASFAECPAPADGAAHCGKNWDTFIIPPGYLATDFAGACEFSASRRDGWLQVDVAGQRAAYLSMEQHTNLSTFAFSPRGPIDGKVPISLIGGGAGAYNVNVVARCTRTNEAYRRWQLKTFQAIQAAYQQALADYNEQVAAAQVRAGVQIEGRNPDINRRIVQDELRKNVLRLLTNQFASTGVNGEWRVDEDFDLMGCGALGYPEPQIADTIASGRIVQFFEQAFEWDKITYSLYPYFWSNRSAWADTFPVTDPDPEFNDFLRCGAARVVVPVRVAYTDAVLRYLGTNEIWNGDDSPTLDDPLFVSIADEVKSEADRDLDGELPRYGPGSGYPCLMDEWELKVPTTLVWLQPDTALPDWRPKPAAAGAGAIVRH